MANIKFPRKEIEKQIKLTPQNIEKITMMGIPVENVNEDEIEIEILANRPDFISMYGFLNAFKRYIGKEKGIKKYKVNKPEKDYIVKVDPSVDKIRPYTACAIVKKLVFDDLKIKEIIEIQEKLHATFGRNRKKIAIGIYPLEKIKLPINYKAEKPQDIKFVPLEGKKEMNGLEILSDHPTGREYAHLLSQKEKFPVFRDSTGKVLSMPPIINSQETGRITNQTKEIFIECSGFDFDSLKKTLNILVTALSDMGGEIYSMEIIKQKNEKIITPDLSSEKIKISLENVNKTLGLDLKEKDIEKCLLKMGYEYSKGNAYFPAWRTDILHEIDVIEDIGIAYGYDLLTPQIPSVSTVGEEEKGERIARKISELLIGLGLLEVSSYYLIKKDELTAFKLDEKIELENSKTEYKYLRPNLMIPSLRIFSENKDNEYPQRIFEIGPVFSKDSNSESGVRQENKLIISLTPSNFTEVKKIFDYISKSLMLELEIKESEFHNFIDGRCAKIYFKNKEVGVMGEVSPECLKNFNIKNPVSMIEINLTNIFN